MVRELIGVIQLKKYRTLKKRYGDQPTDDPVADAAAVAREKFGV